MSAPEKSHRRRAIDGLTPRQGEILELLADGCSNAQVAERLALPLDEVKLHVIADLETLSTSA